MEARFNAKKIYIVFYIVIDIGTKQKLRRGRGRSQNAILTDFSVGLGRYRTSRGVRYLAAICESYEAGVTGVNKE